MIDTVPTPEEVSGDFSDSGVDIYDPTTTQSNPNFNSSLPISTSNPKVIRQQFSYDGKLNVIPPGRITHAAPRGQISTSAGAMEENKVVHDRILEAIKPS